MTGAIHSPIHSRQVRVAVPVAVPGALPVAVRTATPFDSKSPCTRAVSALRSCFRQGQGKP